MDDLRVEIKWAVASLMQVADRLKALIQGDLAVPAYSQRDLRWAGDQLGPSRGGGTLGGAGCAVTCAAMLATAVGCDVTPGELNKWLSENGGFCGVAGSPLNLLLWHRVAEFCPLLEWERAYRWRDKPAEMEVVRLALEHGPTVAEVDFDYHDMDVDQHFVVLVGFVGDDEIEIIDPWDGARVGLVERYYNPVWSAPEGKVARVLTGLRLLRARLEVV